MYIFLNFILAFLSIASGKLYGLQFQGEFQDYKTHEPIPYVNIWIKQKNVRLNSNSEGKFTIDIKPSDYHDTVFFSSIGYKSSYLTIIDLLNNKERKYFMHEDIIKLNEVVVRPLTAKQIIEKGIELLNVNHLKNNYQVKGFYRKAVKEGNQFSSLIESVVNIQNSEYHNRFRVSYFKSRMSKDYRKFKESNKGDIIEEALDLDHVKYGRGFLNFNNVSNWQFKIIGLTRIDNKEIYIIQANLMGNDKLSMHKAVIYISSDYFSFHKIEYDYNWSLTDVKDVSAPSDSIIFKKFKWKGSFSYRQVNGSMVLNYFYFTLSQNIYTKNFINTASGRIKNNKLITTQESHEEFIADDFKIFRKKTNNDNDFHYSSFLDSSIPYDEPFWKTYIRPIDSKLFKVIKGDLEIYAPFDKSFN